MPKVGLQRPGIDFIIGQLEPAGVAQHVGVRFDPKVGGATGALDHAVEAFRRQRRPALGDEHKPRRWRAVALVLAEFPQLPAGQGVRAFDAALEPVDVQFAAVKSTCSHFRSVTSAARRPWR